MHGNMVLVLKIFFKLGKSRKKSLKPIKMCIHISIPNTHKFQNLVTQNRKCSCAKVIQSWLYFIFKYLQTIRNRYTMHGNMILVLNIFLKLGKSSKNRETRKMNTHIRPRLPWDRVVVSIPNPGKLQNPVTQNRKCSCAKVIQSCLDFICKHL